MRMYDIIMKKRNNIELSDAEIDFFVQGYTKGDIPDYQVSALLMAIYFNKMTKRETVSLTKSMINSGETIDLSLIEGIKVDKHSTGGVGDTTTLVLAPIVSAVGAPVAKMSGRGLGHTGGTIDKLESFDNFSVQMSIDKFIDNVNKHKIAVGAQTANLAPADKKLYALRDVTATVDNLSLIASSIMSKKIASGADAIVLDVKTGSGAFMKDMDSAFELANIMVEIGTEMGRNTVAVITNMDEPLGYAVGNALEVVEAIDTLKGKGPDDLKELCLTLGSHMTLLANKAESIEDAREKLIKQIENGKGIEKLKEFVSIQGGDEKFIDDTSLLPQPTYKEDVFIYKEGYVKSIVADEVGIAALLLGAGRETKESNIDLSAGIMLHKKVSDYVEKDTCIATIYSNDKSKFEEVKNRLINSYIVVDEEVEKPKLIKGIVTKDGIERY